MYVSGIYVWHIYGWTVLDMLLFPLSLSSLQHQIVHTYGKPFHYGIVSIKYWSPQGEFIHADYRQYVPRHG